MASDPHSSGTPSPVRSRGTHKPQLSSRTAPAQLRGSGLFRLPLRRDERTTVVESQQKEHGVPMDNRLQMHPRSTRGLASPYEVTRTAMRCGGKVSRGGSMAQFLIEWLEPKNNFVDPSQSHVRLQNCRDRRWSSPGQLLRIDCACRRSAFLCFSRLKAERLRTPSRSVERIWPS